MSKAKFLNRVVAYLIDIVIANIFGLIPVLGGIIGFLFFLFRDGIGDGNGVGKGLMGLKVVKSPSGAPISYNDSVKRNLNFALPSLLLLIPVLGHFIYFFVMLIILIVELVYVVKREDGRRFGDLWAETHVVAK